jgi:AcrR family transcriptional regulator
MKGGRLQMRSDAEANLERIIAAAEDVFGHHGLETSIEVVARHAGVGLGTIYRRFANKDALVSELVRRLLVDASVIAERHLADPDGTGLISYLYEVCELLSGNRGAVARIWSNPDHQSLIKRSRQAQRRLVSQAHAHGTVRSDLTAEDVAIALWSVHGILDVTRGSTIDAWRRHLDLVIAGFTGDTSVGTANPITPQQMTAIIKKARPT